MSMLDKALLASDLAMMGGKVTGMFRGDKKEDSGGDLTDGVPGRRKRIKTKARPC